MKKTLIIILALITLFSFTACGTNKNIPEGYSDGEEHLGTGIQDYTDYCIYKYDSASAVENDSRYSKIDADGVVKIRGYFYEFEQVMAAEERQDEYAFDTSCITEGDYCYIITKEGEKIGNGTYGVYDNYTVCFFDTETLTMYYIHTNI